MAAETTNARLARNWRDMAISMGVVLGLIAIIFLFTYRPPPDNPVRAVDYASEVAAARSSGAFAVAAPAHPEGWTATSVRYRPDPANPKIATWHLGFVSGSSPETDKYVAIEQTNGDDPAFIKTVTAEGKNEGPVTINGMTFTSYSSAETGHRSLLYKTGPVTTVVTGTPSYDELAAFAADLRTS